MQGVGAEEETKGNEGILGLVFRRQHRVVQGLAPEPRDRLFPGAIQDAAVRVHHKARINQMLLVRSRDKGLTQTQKHHGDMEK
jgi:hypothetical protein